MGTKVPWLLASQATDFAKEADLEKVSSKLDDFGKVSGDFAKSSEVPTETEVQELDNRLDAYDLVSGTFLTKTSADTDYALKTEIPSLAEYMKTTDADKKYLTENSANGIYAKKTDIPSLTEYMKTTDADKKYLTKTSADNDYALKTEIPSLTGYMKTTDADAKYLTKTSADTDYASKTHSHTVSDVTDFPTDLVHSNDLAVYTKRSELSTSANWNAAYDYTSTHVGTLTINGTEYDGTEDKTITIQTEGGGLLPPTGADGDYIYRVSSDATNSGWQPMPATGKPIEGTTNEISVNDTAADKTVIGLHEAVKSKLEKIDTALDLEAGTNIEFDTSEPGKLVISSTAEGGGLTKDDFNEDHFDTTGEKISLNNKPLESGAGISITGTDSLTISLEHPLVMCTQATYDTMTKDPNTIYFIYESV